MHEYLSQDDLGVVDLEELAENLLSNTLQGMLDPEKRIATQMDCPKPLTLPSAQATSAALVLISYLVFFHIPGGDASFIPAGAKPALLASITVVVSSMSLP